MVPKTGGGIETPRGDLNDQGKNIENEYDLCRENKEEFVVLLC